MRYFPHILRTVRTGTYLSATRPSRSSRCPELASSYYLCHYRPTSARFCHRLYTSARRSRRSRRSAVPACLPVTCLPPANFCLPLQPAYLCLLLPPPVYFCPLCLLCLLCRSSQPACKKSETFQSLAFLLSGLRLRQAPPRLSARQSRKPSRTSCSRILAQSATGCFSPSTNRSGHPRLQSSM